MFTSFYRLKKTSRPRDPDGFDLHNKQVRDNKVEIFTFK